MTRASRQRLWGKLTARELETLQAAADGETVPETAKRTHHAEGTVKYHRYGAMSKLDCHTIAGAVAKAIRMGLIE